MLLLKLPSVIPYNLTASFIPLSSNSINCTGGLDHSTELKSTSLQNGNEWPEVIMLNTVFSVLIFSSHGNLWQFLVGTFVVFLQSHGELNFFRKLKSSFSIICFQHYWLFFEKTSFTCSVFCSGQMSNWETWRFLNFSIFKELFFSLFLFLSFEMLNSCCFFFISEKFLKAPFRWQIPVFHGTKCKLCS